MLVYRRRAANFAGEGLTRIHRWTNACDCGLGYTNASLKRGSRKESIAERAREALRRFLEDLGNVRLEPVAAPLAARAAGHFCGHSKAADYRELLRGRWLNAA
jgi:hypothetical protein